MKNARTLLSVLVGLSMTAALAEREARAQSRFETVIYGNTYNLQNGRDSSFLDTRGSGCNGDDLCVSTATNPDRSGGSGQWQVLSASGLANGSTVSTGDKVYLLNLANGNGGYLDTDGSGCQGEDLCVSTATSSNRDGQSGTWTPSYGFGTWPLFAEGNAWIQSDYKGGSYLETKGTGCQNNVDCVVTTGSQVSAPRAMWQFMDAGVTYTDYQRGTYGGYPQNRSDLFCYTTLQPQTILQDDAASLVWDEYGNLTLANFETGDAHVWGMNASSPLTSPTTTATLCYESDGNLRILDNAGEIAWQSGTKVTSDANFLSIAECTLRGQHTAGTAWAIATERCNLTTRDDWGGAGWCFNRSTSSNMPILWSDTGIEADWQADGDLVLYNNGNQVFHTNNTLSTAGSQVCFGRSGHPGQLEVLDGNGNELFASATDPSSTAGTDYLEADACSVSLHRPDPGYQGDRIYYSQMPNGGMDCALTAVTPGWCRETTAPARLLDNGTVHLDWQADGNLVLYLSSTSQALWATGTNGTGARLCYQNDQNLVIYAAGAGYNGQGTSVWSSGTYGQPASQLTLLGCSPQIATVAGDQVLATLASPTVCGNPVSGGGFSYSFEQSWGNSDFGAGMWTVAAATNAAAMSNLVSSLSGTAQADVEAMLPTSSVPSTFAEVMANAGVSATLFSQSFTVLEIGGFVGDDDGSTSNLTLDVMGSSSSAPIAANATPLDVTMTFFTEDSDFLVGGVVPVTVSADVTGTLQVTCSLSSGVSSSGPSYSMLGSVTPSADLTISASVGIGTSGFSVGVEGSLTLVDVNVPLTIDFDATTRDYSSAATLNISTLGGDLSLYAEAEVDLGLFTIDEKYTYELASWNGETYSQTLVNSNGSL